MKGSLRTDSAWLEAFFRRADEIYVSFSGAEFPYVIPLNFVWLDGRIYLHSAFEGRKIRLLERDARVGFAAALDVTIVREKSTTWYKSVSGCGRMRIVTDQEEKRRALDGLSLRYAARCPRPAPDEMLRRVNVLCIEVENVFGKERGPR
ncbi:pyridoxamine 5'-phosphate oxidase family protein [uncultured Desulfovibrio sp.]|uniref:Pyridoxamine 5'-phosphate oxidase family protein n=1 Tax=Candidatus Desulfovibrio intestinavium TaxID=2838534 RepID=A0A9D2HL44_9BACT|nr:pyridoxamine 5'-phosphate oxidase family protein [uncultured Desulfovibrio sp.]HJA78731.1 pyridoxamine 5'-phosphate oxidase family protein [Candidatus Desulfovibrio intestinavium]